MFTSDSHAICDMMGVAGVAISCPGCWQLSINRMLGVCCLCIGVRVESIGGIGPAGAP